MRYRGAALQHIGPGPGTISSPRAAVESPELHVRSPMLPIHLHMP